MHHYLDWNATAPLAPEARAAWLAIYDQAWANPGSIHASGQLARHHADQAKAMLAKMLGGKAHEIIITSGGTEANALAIHGIMRAQKNGQADENERIIAVTTIEHSSVLRNAERYATVKIAVDGEGRIDESSLASALQQQPALLCLQFANNEIGVRQNIPRIVKLVKAQTPQTRILVDAAQGAGKEIISFAELGVDFLSLAGHKFGAPKGIGLLMVRSGLRIEPLLFGGRQQQDRRSGTEDVANTVALAAALQAALAHGEEERIRQRMMLEGAFIRIKQAIPDVRWLGHHAERLANTMSLVHPNINNNALVMRLDLAGIAVSTGSACMAARGEPSHVVAALGIEKNLATSVVRISIGPTTSAETIDAFVAAYCAAVKAMK
jgi:cysteine desulfurase